MEGRVLFASWRSGKLSTWKVSIDGGAPVQLAQETSSWPVPSPDGKFFACRYHDDRPSSAWRLAIYPIAGGQPVKLLDITANVRFDSGLSWTADGQAMMYVDTRGGVSNICSHPIDGSPPRQLTNFKSDLIFRFASFAGWPPARTEARNSDTRRCAHQRLSLRISHAAWPSVLNHELTKVVS